MLYDEAEIVSAAPQPGRRRPLPFQFNSTHGLYAIVLVGALLRFVPVWFALPYLRARPDEETAVGHAMAVLAGDPNPHFFHWPSLTFYALAALFQVASWTRWALLANGTLTDPEYFVIARMFVAAAGTLTIAVLFGLTRRVAGRTTGLVAAALLALAILHVRE